MAESTLWRGACAALALLSCMPAHAEEARQGGKLPLTAGVSSVEGSAGGGLATWALIAGDETEAGIGASAHVTYVPLANFSLTSFGGAIGVHDRLELSYAHERFDTQAAGALLGLGRGYVFSEDVVGAKLRLVGNAVFDQDSWLPQIAIGVQHKWADRGAVIHAIGGKAVSGTDFYVSATKLILPLSLVTGGTIRFTKANQFGLLGFGGDKSDSYHATFEGSAALLLTPRIAVGGEVRTKPDNLGFAREGAAYDLFAAWTPVRHLAFTAAYADLGSIATVQGQHGAFLSVQTSF